MAELNEFPLKVGRVDTEGVNNAVDAVITDENLRKGAIDLLQKSPRLLVRRMMQLNPYQRAALDEMPDEELSTMLKPIVKALQGDKYSKLRVVSCCEHVTTNSPMRIRTTFEYQS